MKNILPKIVNIVAEATDCEFRMESYGKFMRDTDFEVVLYLWESGVPLVIDNNTVKYESALHDMSNWSFDAQFAEQLALIMRAIEDVMNAARMVEWED